MLLASHPRQIRNIRPVEDGDESQPSSHAMSEHLDDASDGASIPPHPLGIRPLGNKYFSNGDDARTSLGTLQVMPDEMLIQLLEFLDGRALRLLGYTCRFLFACSMSDDIWKAIFLE